MTEEDQRKLLKVAKEMLHHLYDYPDWDMMEMVETVAVAGDLIKRLEQETGQ